MKEAGAQGEINPRRQVRTGLEILKAEEFARLRGERIGLLTNASAVDGEYRSIVDLMADAGVRLEVLFGPEHGFFSTAQDMIGVGGESHRVRVISLYGGDFATLRPRAEDMRMIDTLVFDIQGIGSRYYTYVWTLALAMETAARTGTRVMVLDRPNPITGAHVEGGGLEAQLRSFVGYLEIPNRHGQTAGEVAGAAARAIEGGLAPLDALAAQEKQGGAKKTTPPSGRIALDVVRMEGWRRSMWHDETGAPWVFPSPNMPTPETALVYPGQALLEGTNLSEGRGTTRPFEVCGAPWIDGRRLAGALETEAATGNLPGVRFRPLRFRPTFQKWAGEDCGGVQIHVTDREAFRPWRTSLALVRHARSLWPREFQWRTECYEFRDDVPAFDLLAGDAALREMIDAGAPVSELIERAEQTGRPARRRRDEALLYTE